MKSFVICSLISEGRGGVSTVHGPYSSKAKALKVAKKAWGPASEDDYGNYIDDDSGDVLFTINALDPDDPVVTDEVD